MKRIWPLLLPVAVIGFMALFMAMTRRLGKLNAECYIHKSTGYHCPGCGGTRCTHDLIAGNWLEALGHHAPLTVGCVVFIALSLYLIIRVTILGHSNLKLPNISTSWIIAGVGLLVMFTILRNVPVWPFSLLAP